MTSDMATDAADLADRLGADLSTVRLARGGSVATQLRRAGLVAAAYGRTILLDEAGLQNSNPSIRRGVMAHELVHTLQQTDGARWVRSDHTPAALEAEATHIGHLASHDLPLPPRRRDGGPLTPRLQGHDSFEHRLLGDTPTNLLTALVAGQGTQAARDAGLECACALLDYLGSNPTALDPATVSSLAGFPVRMVNLTGSQLAVTYGELNTMADFLTSPEEIDTFPQSILLPILQMVRHQG